MGFGGSQTTKTTQKLDPKLEATLYGRVNDAKAFAANTPYNPLSADQIRQYENPYTQDVVDATMNDVNRYRQIENVDNSARASMGGAWGGARHGVLDAETQLNSERNLAGILGGLRSQGYQQAVQTGQSENQANYNWLLGLQQLQNQSVGMIPQYGTSKGTTTSNPGWGGILQAGLGVASMFSDVRLKADIVPLGYIDGRQWYNYRYLWDEPGVTRQGVMAHEVLKTDPQAVSTHPSGYLMVDYSQLGA